MYFGPEHAGRRKGSLLFGDEGFQRQLSQELVLRVHSLESHLLVVRNLEERLIHILVSHNHFCSKKDLLRSFKGDHFCSNFKGHSFKEDSHHNLEHNLAKMVLL